MYIQYIHRALLKSDGSTRWAGKVSLVFPMRHSTAGILIDISDGAASFCLSAFSGSSLARCANYLDHGIMMLLKRFVSSMGCPGSRLVLTQSYRNVETNPALMRKRRTAFHQKRYAVALT